MSCVKYKVYDLQGAQSEFDIILDILGDKAQLDSLIVGLDSFSMKDFPVIAEGPLYETMFEGAVGVTYNDFTETVIDKYNTDINGILPNSITGGLVLGAGVFAVVSGWAEITAAVMVLYDRAAILASTIGAFVSAGYQWLIGSA